MAPFTPAWFLVFFLLPAILSTGILFFFSIPSSSPSRFRIEAGWALAVGLGLGLTLLLGYGIPTPLFSTSGLYLLVLLPILIILGIISALPQIPRSAKWIARVLIAIGIPVLLLKFKWTNGTWSTSESILWLGGLGLATALIWSATQLLAERSPGRSLTFNMGLSCAITGVLFCMSGGLVLGSVALALGIAVAGALAVSLRLPKVISNKGSLVVVLPALLGLLIQARFLQTDTPPIALFLIALAPLTQWITEIPILSRRSSRQIAIIRTIAILIPLLAALIPVAWTFLHNVPEDGY